MEAVIRTRLTVAATAFAVLTACSEGEVVEPGGGPTPTTSGSQVLAEQAAARLEGIANRHLNLLRGTMGQSLLELREVADGPSVQVLFCWPDRLRVQSGTEGRLQVRVSDRSSVHEQGRAPTPVEAEEHARLVALQEALALALLVPLEGSPRVVHATENVVQFEADGVIHEAHLDGDRLLRLKNKKADVSFDLFLETGLTILPARVHMAGIGERRIRILDSGLRLEGRAFSDPAGPGLGAPVTGPDRQDQEKPAKPVIQRIPARRYLLLVDDGEWSRRMQRLNDAGLYLFNAGQLPDGLPTYFELEGKAVCGVPFQPARTDGTSPETTPEHRIHRVPAHDALVVVPPGGHWPECVARGRVMLAQALAREGRAAAGGIRVVLFVSPGGPPPTPEQLAALELRLELPLR